MSTLFGEDIEPASGAACIDATFTIDLSELGITSGRIDLVKNLLSFVAAEIIGNKTQHISEQRLAEIQSYFESRFLEDVTEEITALTAEKGAIKNTGDGFSFKNELSLYFFAGRHVSKFLRTENEEVFEAEIDSLISEMYRKSNANVLLFANYFSTDAYILKKIVLSLSKQIQGVEQVGLPSPKYNLDTISNATTRLLSISEDDAEVRNERINDLKSDYRLSVSEIDVKRASAAVSSYGSLDANVFLDDDAAESREAYIDEMHGLFRAQALVCHCIGMKQGEFDKSDLLPAVQQVVFGTGRLANLTSMLGDLMIDDIVAGTELLKERYPKDTIELSALNKIDEKVHRNNEISDEMRKWVFFLTYWTPMIAYHFAGRQLGMKSAIKAIEILKNEDSVEPDLQDAFSVVQTLAQMHNSTSIDRVSVENLLDMGERNPLVKEVLRFSAFTILRTSPINGKDRQWLSSKLGIELKKSNVAQRKLHPKFSV